MPSDNEHADDKSIDSKVESSQEIVKELEAEASEPSSEDVSGDDGSELEEDLPPTAPLNPEVLQEVLAAVDETAEEAVSELDDAPSPLPPIRTERHEPSIHFAQRCDLGSVRQRNEDSSFAFVAQSGGQQPMLPFALCLVADGMGGHHAGHEASRRVAREVVHHVMTRIYLPLIQDRPAGQSIREVMEDAVSEANRALYTPDPDKEGGTTLTAVLIIGRRLFLIHVGDSRAYLLQDDQLRILTKDHTVVQRLQDAGHITAEEAEKHPHRHLLYKAITGGDIELDEDTLSLPREGKLLLCSDGLWGSIPDAQLKDVLADPEASLQEQADKLVKMAIDGGSTDNVTAIVVDFRL